MINNDSYAKLMENIIQNNRSKKVSETKTVRSGGIGFCGLLAIVFITLKLAQIGPVATWSWWLVLSPLWLPIVLAIACVVIFVIICNRC